MKRVWPPLLLLAAGIGLWELVVRAAHVPDYLFPAPSAVGSALGSDAGLLAHATLVTLREVVLGYLLALGLALVLAVLLHFSTALRQALLRRLPGRERAARRRWTAGQSGRPVRQSAEVWL